MLWKLLLRFVEICFKRLNLRAVFLIGSDQCCSVGLICVVLEMGIVFVDERIFWERTKFLWMKVSWRKNERWTNDLDRSEKSKKDLYLKTNDINCLNELEKKINGRSNFSKDFDKNYRFTKRTIFEAQFCKNYYFFMNKQFFPTNSKNSFFTERTILINKLFYWTNKVDGKWTIYLRTNEIIFLNDWENERNGSFTNDEPMKWKNDDAV